MLRVHLIRLCAFSEQHQRICFNRKGEKAEESEIKLPTSVELSKKQESSRKNIYFCFIDYDIGIDDIDCVDDNKLENSSRDGNTRPPDLPLEKSASRSGSKS